MSLIATVTAMVVTRGEATADHLLPALEGFTRKQVQAALQNATFAGRLSCDGPTFGGRHGRLPGVYRPPRLKAPAPTAAPVASVWARA